ncbi:MAG: 3-deoxy-7-phosphoheptulonate synthase [Phycisphaeraceae bacterium]|nr:3-deoxy-7-phosphoheptulonate synthase [Phycisphaeraceae bacterium]
MTTLATQDWTPFSWTGRPSGHLIAYTDERGAAAAVERLTSLPPLVTSWEIERLRELIASAQRGERFLVQGGDCAERFADCRPEAIAATLKVLLQVSLVVIGSTGRPVVRVGRLAGQYAKPRTSATETRTIEGEPVTLPAYYGDLVNGEAFTPEARRPDPWRLVEGYQQAAATLNFVRSLLMGGFADINHPEYWDLGVMHRAGLPESVLGEYQRVVARLLGRLRDGGRVTVVARAGGRGTNGVGAATGGGSGAWELTRSEMFTSHEGLNLLYEGALTRQVPSREGHYDLSAHLPWIGERTRGLDGPHVEFFRGVRNPVGVKVGPGMTGAGLVELLDAINPENEWGKAVVITRLGASAVRGVLPGLVKAVADAGRRVLWVCDPMHGNTTVVPRGAGRVKTRRYEDVESEVLAALETHRSVGSRLGGLHIEVTGEDVTECTGGAGGVTEADLARRYETACDPRLNYEQALELVLRLGAEMGEGY